MLSQHDHVLLCRKRIAVPANLVSQPVVGRLGIGTVEWNEERQNPGAFDVLEKPESEPFAGMRPLDDSGYVGDEKASMIGEASYSQIGLERGERIVRDLGACGGNDRQEGTLARVGLTDEADIGDQL